MGKKIKETSVNHSSIHQQKKDKPILQKPQTQAGFKMRQLKFTKITTNNKIESTRKIGAGNNVDKIFITSYTQ